MNYRVPHVRVALVRDGSRPSPERTVNRPADAATIARAFLDGYDREAFLLLCLNTKHRVIAAHVVSIGTLDMSPVHPREVFKAAILANAQAIIVSHNHPSGDPTPSTADKDITRALVDAGRLLKIPVLDHVILGDDTFQSLRELGLITGR